MAIDRRIESATGEAWSTGELLGAGLLDADDGLALYQRKQPIGDRGLIDKDPV
jgi:hypothetical protein